MKRRRHLFLVSMILLASACAAVPLHPGAVNRADSVAYDTLTVAQAIIEQSRTEAAAGTLPEVMKPALNRLVDSYNVGRASWLAYRAAVKARTPADVAGLRRLMDALTESLTAFNRTRSIQ